MRKPIFRRTAADVQLYRQEALQQLTKVNNEIEIKKKELGTIQINKDDLQKNKDELEKDVLELVDIAEKTADALSCYVRLSGEVEIESQKILNGYKKLICDLNVQAVEKRNELAETIKKNKKAHQKIVKEFEVLDKAKTDLDIYKKRLEKEVKENGLKQRIIVKGL